jgi:hypothetical protein
MNGFLERINSFGNNNNGVLAVLGILFVVVTGLGRLLWYRVSRKEQKGFFSWAVLDLSMLAVAAMCIASFGFRIEHGVARLVLIWVFLILLGAFLLSLVLIFAVRAHKYSWPALRALHRDVFRRAVEVRQNEAARKAVDKLLQVLMTLPPFAQSAVSPIALTSVQNLLGTETEELNVDEYTKMLMASIRHPGVNRVILFSTYKPIEWGLPPADLFPDYEATPGLKSKRSTTGQLSPVQDKAWGYFRDTHKFMKKRLNAHDPIRVTRVLCISLSDWISPMNDDGTPNVNAADANRAFADVHGASGIQLYRVDPTPADQLPYDMGLFATKNNERLVVWSKKGDLGTSTCRVRVEHSIFDEYERYLNSIRNTCGTTGGAAERDQDFSWGNEQ